MFLASDLWIFHFLSKISFVADFSILRKSKSPSDSKLITDNFLLYWFHKAPLKSCIDPTTANVCWNFILLSWQLSLCEEIEETMFGWWLPSSTLPSFQRKLSSESCCCWIIWRGNYERNPAEIRKETLEGNNERNPTYFFFDVYSFQIWIHIRTLCCQAKKPLAAQALNENVFRCTCIF